MSLLLGGVVAAVIGLISLIFWWSDFLAILRAAHLPFSGRRLAVYVGFDDIQDKIREERQRQNEELSEPGKKLNPPKPSRRYRDEPTG